MNISNLSSSQLRRAAAIKDQIESLQSELAKLFGSGAASDVVTKGPVRKRRRMSAAARAKIGAAARARWAKVRAAKK